MIVPPIWQTRYKGRITAKTFGTVFASSYQCNYHAKHGYYYYFIICCFGTLFATPSVGVSDPPRRKGKIGKDTPFR